jgi:hypothetical protein
VKGGGRGQRDVQLCYSRCFFQCQYDAEKTGMTNALQLFEASFVQFRDGTFAFGFVQLFRRPFLKYEESNILSHTEASYFDVGLTLPYGSH